jgi:RNA polymerase sigma factor (sigma-70 family)
MSLSLPLEARVNSAQDLPNAEDLAREFGPLVYRTAYRLLGDAGLAEDVQQEIFLRVLERPPSGVEAWPAWLATAASRAAIDLLRKRNRWWQRLAQWRLQAPTATPSAEQATLDRERANRLRQALAGLPRREAQCFGLRYLEGMDIEAIAEALGLTANNVNVCLHRARRRLETRLQAHEEGVEA